MKTVKGGMERQSEWATDRQACIRCHFKSQVNQIWNGDSDGTETVRRRVRQTYAYVLAINKDWLLDAKGIKNVCKNPLLGPSVRKHPHKMEKCTELILRDTFLEDSSLTYKWYILLYVCKIHRTYQCPRDVPSPFCQRRGGRERGGKVKDFRPNSERRSALPLAAVTEEERVET